MKRILTGLLLLLSVVSQAQTINFTADTLLRVPGRSRIAFPDGQNPYLVPASGNASLLFRTASKTIAQVRAMGVVSINQAPDVISITDARKRGLFVLDVVDKSTPDNTGTTLVTAGGLRYKRVITDRVSVEWWNVIGDGQQSSDSLNRVGIQAAIDFVDKSADPLNFGAGTPNQQRPNTVYIPSGTYFIDKSLQLKGAVRLIGDGGLSFGGTLLYTSDKARNLNMIELAAGSNGAANAAEVVDLRLRLVGSFGTVTSAIYSGAPANSSFHSLRVRNVWFQLDGGFQRAYTGLLADDIKFENITLDGTVADGAIWLGDATHMVSNVSLNNSTCYANKGGLIRAINVDGLQVTNNRIYSNLGAIPYVVDALNNSPVRASRIQVINNNCDYVYALLRTKFSGAQVTGNTMRNAYSRVVEFGGGGIVQDCRVTENVISGVWSGTIGTGGGNTAPDAPIYAFGTTLSNCVIDNTVTDSSATSPTAYYIPQTASPYNMISGSGLRGFGNALVVGSYNVNVPDANRYVQGTTSQSRTTYSNTPDADVPSGPYNWNVGSIRGVSDASNNFLGLTLRHENGSGSGGFWAGRLLKPLFGPGWYEESQFADASATGTAGWNTPKRLHSNRWFPVNELISATTAGQVLVSNGTQFTNGYPAHITSGSVSPAVSTSTGAGSSPTVSLNAGSEVSTDLSGVISLTTGSSPANGLIVRVTYAGAYSRIPKVVIDGANDAAVLNRTLYRVSNRTTTGFDLVNTSSNTLPASTSFLITYTVTE